MDKKMIYDSLPVKNKDIDRVVDGYVTQLTPSMERSAKLNKVLSKYKQLPVKPKQKTMAQRFKDVRS